MDGQLSRSSAVFSRDPVLRATFPGARKYPQITLQSGVLSGFPTAAESSFPRCLPPRTSPRDLLADQRVSQRLARDDIPPQPVVVTLEVCCLRLARRCFLLALRLYLRVQYGKARQKSFLVGSRSRSCGKANSE